MDLNTSGFILVRSSMGSMLNRVVPLYKKAPLVSVRFDLLRGGVTKKKSAKFGKNSQGGGMKKNRRKFPISILKTQGGGVSIFQKCLNYKSGSDPILERRIEN